MIKKGKWAVYISKPPIIKRKHPYQIGITDYKDVFKRNGGGL